MCWLELAGLNLDFSLVFLGFLRRHICKTNRILIVSRHVRLVVNILGKHYGIVWWRRWSRYVWSRSTGSFNSDFSVEDCKFSSCMVQFHLLPSPSGPGQPLGRAKSTPSGPGLGRLVLAPGVGEGQIGIPTIFLLSLLSSSNVVNFFFHRSVVKSTIFCPLKSLEEH